MKERKEKKEGNKLAETQKDIYVGRKTLGDQLHQSVQTEDSSFSLRCYLATSQSLRIRNRMLKKKRAHYI